MRPSGGSVLERSRKSGTGGGLFLQVQLDQLDAARAVLDANRVARLDQQAGNVAALPLSDDVAVRNQLAGAGPVRREAEAMDDVIQAALHDAQQRFAGVFRRARGQREVAAELALEDAVEALELLLFAEADAVFARLAAADVHAGSGVAPLDGALGLSQRLPLRNSLMPSRRHSLQTGSIWRAIDLSSQ